MIEFHYETDFKLENEAKYLTWITHVCESEGYIVGDLNYIFCNDTFLLNINQTYLRHDTYTDIITFDYSTGRTVSGDIFVSTERVLENSERYLVSFQEELLRVMGHGLLHLMKYEDKGQDRIIEMRAKENEKIKMFHVEQ